jgi:hypothetical protein
MATTKPAGTQSSPQTTGASPIPSGTIQGPSCGPPRDYLIIRKEKLKKITDYYDSLLSNYTKSYTDYASQNSSVNSNDRTYANTTLKPKIENYNTQIINLSKNLIDAVNKDNDLILEQINELNTKSESIDTIMSDIKLLKEKDIDENILEKSQNDSLDITKSSAEDLDFTSQVYMGINILLVLLVIGLIAYLVYSNYKPKINNSVASTNSSNSTSTSTNNNIKKIYKTIKDNTKSTQSK